MSAVIHFILPIIDAVVIWFLTSSLLYAGVAFVVVALLQLIVRRRVEASRVGCALKVSTSTVLRRLVRVAKIEIMPVL